jgi:hypothetical protein
VFYLLRKALTDFEDIKLTENQVPFQATDILITPADPKFDSSHGAAFPLSHSPIPNRFQCKQKLNLKPNGAPVSVTLGSRVQLTRHL